MHDNGALNDVRGFGGSGVQGSIPTGLTHLKWDHRPQGSGDEQALVTRSIQLLKEGVAGKTRACGYLAPNDPIAA